MAENVLVEKIKKRMADIQTAMQSNMQMIQQLTQQLEQHKQHAFVLQGALAEKQCDLDELTPRVAGQLPTAPAPAVAEIVAGSPAANVPTAETVAPVAAPEAKLITEDVPATQTEGTATNG